MRALIAFDKFKDALTAQEACLCAKDALLTQIPEAEIEIAPLADGGDGFCDTLTAVVDGKFAHLEVVGPLGKPTTAKYGIVSTSALQDQAVDLLNLPEETQSIAIVELAQTSGIALTPLERRSPWITHTYGLGQLIHFLSEQDTDCILIGLGGSATHDLALGTLQALGFRFYTSSDAILSQPPSPENWGHINRIEAPTRTNWPAIRIACDVDNPLTGPKGAAAIFGPQKGLKADEFENLDSLTTKLAQLLSEATQTDIKETNTPGTGAAGGAAFGLMQGLNGKIVSGYELVDAWTALSPKLANADTVITGEGRFDESSLGGKGPGSLAKEAIRLNKATHVFAGSLSENIAAAIKLDTCNAISPAGLPLAEALKQTAANLTKTISTRFCKSGH